MPLLRKNRLEGKEGKNKISSKSIIAIILGGILLVTGVGYTYTKTIKANNEINSEMVSREREYKVEKGDLVAGIDSTGKIKLKQKTQNFEESVTIDEVFVKVGQRINKGDKIASLSTTKINEKIKELNNQLKEINASSQQNINTQNNTSNGNEQNHVSSGSTLNNKLNQDTKNDGIDIASSNNQIDTSSKYEIKKQISKLEKLKKSPVLYAESSGIVFDVGYSAGEETLKEKPVITIAEEGDIFAEIPVSQDDILDIEVGQQVYVWVSAYEGEQFTGKVDFINLKASSESGSSTFSVTVKLDEGDYELLDGMSISSQFIIKELKDVLILSNKAITLKDGKQMVKVRQEDGTLKEKVITTGFSDGKKSEITSGLKEGDTAVVGGQ